VHVHFYPPEFSSNCTHLVQPFWVLAIESDAWFLAALILITVYLRGVIPQILLT
jgi:hypothetical protein